MRSENSLLFQNRMSIDGHSHQVLQTLKGHTSDVTCCDIAPNFTIITGSR